MTEKSFPFNSELVDDIPDRQYYAEDFARYFEQFIGNGVYPNPANGLKVLSNDSNIVTVKKGAAFINGYGYALEEDMDIEIDLADPNYNRKDSVVVRLNIEDREINTLYLPGEPASSPTPPALVRTKYVYDLRLAVITVKANTVAVRTSDILDTRLNGDVCGIVSGLIESVDTTALFDQYEDYLNQKIAEWDATQTQQSDEWQEQMDEQQGGFDELTGTIEAWYNSVKVDITLLQSFSFDNLAELKGCSKSTTFNQNGSISERITKTVGGAKVADRDTIFNTNGSISVTTTVYEDDGQTIMKQAVVTTTFDGDTISEVIV